MADTLVERMREVLYNLEELRKQCYGSTYYEGYGAGIRRASQLIAAALKEQETSDGRE